MSLSALNWKRLPIYVIPAASGSNVAGILSGIFDVFNSTTYYDASPRVTGSNSAWSFFRSFNAGAVESVYGYPPTITSMSQSVIFAGSVAAPSVLPKMVPNSYITTSALPNILLMGVSTNSGRYLNWTSQFVFLSGSNGSITSSSSFSGFAPISNIAPTVTNEKFIFAWECQEAVAIQLAVTTSRLGGAYSGIAGAIIDPESDSLLDANRDGRLYSVITSGNTASISFLAQTNDFLNHDTVSTSTAKFVYLSPTENFITASVRPLSLIESRVITYQTTSSSGRIPRFNNYVKDLIRPNFVGRLREIKSTFAYQSGWTLRSASIDLGHLFGARCSQSLSVSTSGSTLFLVS
jgi:hypothetical protein